MLSVFALEAGSSPCESPCVDMAGWERVDCLSTIKVWMIEIDIPRGRGSQSEEHIHISVIREVE